MTNVPLIDLKPQQKLVRENVEKRIKKILDHGMYIFGPEIKELEEKLASFTGTKYALACASGTDALQLALMAVGVRPGDAVFVPSFTFVATAEVVSILGATPVFIDIDPETYNISVDDLQKKIKKIKSEKKLTPKAIIPVDLFGLIADYGAIEKIAKENNLFVIEDAAQSFGASFKSKKACSFGDIGCTSFFPAKPLGCYGDGGMVFTNNEDFYKKIKSIHNHGQGSDKYNNVRIGINSRLDSIQAAVLLEKMEIFPEEIKKRNEIANSYNKAFKGKVVIQEIPAGNISAWAQYCIQIDDRDKLIKKLQENKIGQAIYYPIPLHLQEAYKYLGYKKGDLPVCEGVAQKIMALPMYPYLGKEEQGIVVENIC